MEAAVHPMGLGLRNCIDRLSALYGKEARISTGSGRDGKGFAVVIHLPYREMASPALATWCLP
jgi:sensor histidine kinase YesM